MDTKIHKLEIKPYSAKTLCGQEIIAYYPISNSAMLAEAGKDPINVTVGVQGVNCEVCKKKIKEPNG